MFFKANQLGKISFKVLTLLTTLMLLVGSVGFWFIKNETEKELRKEGNSNISLPRVYTDALVFSVLGKVLSIEPIKAAEAKMVDLGQGTVRYENAYSKTDVEQIRMPNKLKESLILKGPGHPKEFVYQLGDLSSFEVEKKLNGDLEFYPKGNKNDLQKLFVIEAPFMLEQPGGQLSFNGGNQKRGEVAMELDQEKGLLILRPDLEWLKNARYPVILDPTVEISILNVYSYPEQGENWVVGFTTLGTGDLKIIPNDQATIDEDEFVSLTCDGKIITPQILPGEAIYAPNWQCGGVGQITHYTKVKGHHTLRFEFSPPNGEAGGQTAYAFNGGGSGADGAVTISTSKNINTDTIATGRSTYGDGIATAVSAIAAAAVTVASANGLAAGDKVLLINMQGTATYNANVGNWETFTISSVDGTTINFSTSVTKIYGDAASNAVLTNQKIVLQRMPQYTTVTIQSGGTLTASAWNGTSGGIVAFYATGALTIDSGGKIDASSIGFRGGDSGSAGQPEGYTGRTSDLGGDGGNGSSAGGYFGGGGGGNTGNPDGCNDPCGEGGCGWGGHPGDNGGGQGGYGGTNMCQAGAGAVGSTASPGRGGGGGGGMSWAAGGGGGGSPYLSATNTSEIDLSKARLGGGAARGAGGGGGGGSGGSGDGHGAVGGGGNQNGSGGAVGGGSGSCASGGVGVAGATGGAGGGIILIFSGPVTINGDIWSKGGAGGAGGQGGSGVNGPSGGCLSFSGSGGGGGGADGAAGGSIYFEISSLTGDTNVSVVGGSAGTAGAGNTAGFDGGAGGAGAAGDDGVTAIVYTNAQPTITSVADAPDPIGVGSFVNFTMDWDDADVGDMIRVIICKTYEMATSTLTCGGGAWASDGGFTNRDPETVTYKTVAADKGNTRAYYAYVCDNSGDVTTGCSVPTSGTFTVANQIPDAPISLLVEGMEVGTAINLTDTTPEFSFVYKDVPDEGDLANKYCVEVDTQADFAGTQKWATDSANCYTGTAIGSNVSESARSPDLSYAAAALALDGTTYYWRAWFWDDDGERGATSTTGWFRVGNSVSGDGVRLKGGRLKGGVRLK